MKDKNLFIPKGSYLYVDDVKHVITNDLKAWQIPVSSDFSPEIPNGTTMDVFHVYCNGVEIYRHPVFLKSYDEIISLIESAE